MSETVYISSTPFCLPTGADGDTSQAEEKVAELIERHMDRYPVELEEGEAHNSFRLTTNETVDVGNSFHERVEALLDEMMAQDLILTAACITIRDDSMSDDRDRHLYVGPNHAAITYFREEERINAIAELMGHKRHDEAMRPIARRLRRKTLDEYNALMVEQSKFADVDMGGETFNINWARFTAINMALNDSGWKSDPELGPVQVPCEPTVVIKMDEGTPEVEAGTEAINVIFVTKKIRELPVYSEVGVTGFTNEHLVAYSAHMAHMRPEVVNPPQRPRGG